jgi:hypothetical protein
LGARVRDKWLRGSANQIAKGFGIPVGNCTNIVHDVLNMCRVCQHLARRMPKTEQKLTRKSVSVDLIDIADKDNKLLNNIIKELKT